MTKPEIECAIHDAVLPRAVDEMIHSLVRCAPYHRIDDYLLGVYDAFYGVGMFPLAERVKTLRGFLRANLQEAL